MEPVLCGCVKERFSRPDVNERTGQLSEQVNNRKEKKDMPEEIILDSVAVVCGNELSHSSYVKFVCFFH